MLISGHIEGYYQVIQKGNILISGHVQGDRQVIREGNELISGHIQAEKNADMAICCWKACPSKHCATKATNEDF